MAASGTLALAAHPTQAMWPQSTPANPQHAGKMVSTMQTAVDGRSLSDALPATPNRSAQNPMDVCGTKEHVAPKTELTYK